jgi:hypothetical protein
MAGAVVTPGFAKSRQELPWLPYARTDRVIINQHNFPSSTPISLVASIAAAPGLNGGTTGSITTTGATLIVICISSYGLGLTSTPTDSKGNTYTGLTSITGGQSRNRIFYCSAPSVGSGHTFTYSATTSALGIHVMAFSGVSTLSPFLDETGSSSSSTNSISGGSLTPASSGALIVTGLTLENSIAGLAISSPFTIQTTNAYVNGSAMGGASGYYVQPTAAAINPTWTWTTTTGAGCRVAVFKAA